MAFLRRPFAAYMLKRTAWEGHPTMSWNLSPPPGFQGLHPDKPVTMYERHLPHWRQEGATYFVTSRLGDSLPQNKLHELDGLRKEWERLHPLPRSKEVLEEHTREIVQKKLNSGSIKGWEAASCASLQTPSLPSTPCTSSTCRL